jgi:hypothetical protein
VAAVAAGSQHMRPKRKNGKKTRFCRSAEAVAAAVLEPSPPSFPTVIPMMAGSGDDDGLAALHEQVALASSAAISASDLDYAFQLQLFEAIQASLRGQSSPNAAAASSSASPQAAPFPLQEPPSDAACALTLQAADLALAEQDHRDAEACHAALALAAVPEDRWAAEGNFIERPLLDSSASARPHFRVFSKGMASTRPRRAPRHRADRGGGAQDAEAGGGLGRRPDDAGGDGSHGGPRRRARAGHPERDHRHRLRAAAQPCRSLLSHLFCFC